MIERVMTLPLTDGGEVHARLFIPDGPPVGAASYVHGLQSHSGWFLNTARDLAEAGLIALLADRRGSGANPRDQAGRSDHKLLVQDVLDSLTHLRRIAKECNAPDVPLGLIGHSLGGLTSTIAVAGDDRSRADWLYLISPALALTSPRTRESLLETAGVFWRFAFAPDRQAENPIPPEMLSSEPEGQAFIKNDPDKLNTVEGRFLRCYEHLRKQLSRARAIEVPVLAVLAGEDQLVDNKKTQKTLDRLCKSVLSVHTFEGCAHTLEFSSAAPEQVPMLVEFLKAQKKL